MYNLFVDEDLMTILWSLPIVRDCGLEGGLEVCCFGIESSK